MTALTQNWKRRFIHEERSPSVTRRLESDLCQFVELDELILMVYSIFLGGALN
jgi:hypothetical protein